jgi:hypothetical protein
MLNRHFKIASSFLAIAAACTFASADEVSIATRFGPLKTNADWELQFKGKPVAPAVSLVSSAYVLATYKLGSSDVVFVSQAAGNACPGQFAFVVVSAEGARATPSFGTCYDDEVKPVQVGESIAFSMKKMGGKGSVRYVYERGVVFENGKPVQ